MHTLLLAAWIGCQSLDLGTTVYALQSPRFVEGNRLMRGRHLVPVKVSVNVAAFVWLYRKKPTPVRIGIPLIYAAAGCTAGTLNMRKLVRRVLN